MAYNISLTGKNKDEAEQLMRWVAEIFEYLGMSYFLEGGTLLGIRRENRILPWDNDVDFSVLSKEIEKLPQLRKALIKKGLRLKIRYYEKDENPCFKKGDIRIFKIRKYRFFSLLKGRVAVDVFVKYHADNNYFWRVGENTLKSCPKAFYDENAKIKFKDFNYPTPTPIDNYLAHRYGKDWQVAKPDWDTFIDDTSIVR